jgi:class 3 adenylate cyclase
VSTSGSLEALRAPPPSVPTSIGRGRYQLKRFLGEGGRKRVYLAEDSSLNREVAVAIIKTDGLDQTGMTRARREAEAMGQLGDHPHIVTIHDIGEDAGQLYIVSQFMAGGDLDGVLRNAEDRRLPCEDAMRIGEQVCSALEHAHSHGVVHRDIKPQNVWLTKDGTVKLGDFGLAVALDRSRITLEGMMVGTVTYMPPEQGLGRPVDARSDLYSLGALLYEIVCGHPPFVGDDAVSIISQHINTPPVAPTWHNRDVPSALEELILKMLAKSPDERPKSAADVQQILAAISSGDAVLEPIAHDRATPLDRLASGVFAGRERETKELRGALEAILSGRGRLVMLAGEMGIGKTRMAAELATYASLRGAQVLWGRCYEGEGAPAYWPWAQVIRASLGDRDPHEISREMGGGAVDIAQIAPDVRERLPGLPQPAQMEADQARFRLFESVTNYLRTASAGNPLVIILDDLHWADKPSLLLLQFLACELEGSRVLVLGTYRDAEVEKDHPLSDVLAAVRRERDYKRVVLKGLELDEVVALLEAVAEHELGPNEIALVRAFQTETEGNPFFTEELIRHLVETGHLYQEGDRWVSDARSLEEIGVPEGVREIVDRRVGRLSDECSRVLSAASVVGREFGLDVLRSLTELGDAELLDTMDEAIRARIVSEVTGAVGRYRFAHGLTRDTLYEALPTTRRVQLHRQIAETLERVYERDPDPHLSELAYHFNQAVLVGGADKAVEYAVRAGQRATEMLAFEQAVEQYERAIKTIEQSQPSDRARLCDLENACGESLWSVGEFDRAREAFAQAASIARELADGARLARAALGFGGQLAYGAGYFDETLIAMLEDAIALAEESDVPMRARLTGRLAEARTFGSDRQRCLDLSAEAVSLARESGDAAVLAAVLSNVHWATWNPDNLAERKAMADEIVSLADSIGNGALAVSGRLWRLCDYLEEGDVRTARREAETWARLARDRRQLYELWYVAIYQAMCALSEGRLNEAETLANHAFEIGQRGQNQNAFQFWGVQIAGVRRHQNRYHELEDGLKAFVADFPAVVAWRGALAALYSDSNQQDAARREFESLAANGFKDLQRDQFWMIGMTLLAHACGFLEDAERASTLYDMLEPYAGRNVMIVCGYSQGSTSRALGVLARTAQKWEDAARHFEDALAEHTDWGARAWLAHTQYEYAEMLLARDESGDRAKALDLLGQALDLAQELGLGWVIDRALTLKLRTQGIESSDVSTSIVAVASDVGLERPDLRAHAAPDGTVTVLFTDIVDSTATAVRLGDAEWLSVLREHNAIVREQVRSFGGFEVKSQGDGFMVAFSSANRALDCAIGIQRAFAARRNGGGEEPIHVRIGLHTGEALRDQDDFFGKNVILAARIAAQAGADEILASSLVRQLSDGTAGLRFGEERDLELKGLAGSYVVYPTEWELESEAS